MLRSVHAVWLIQFLFFLLSHDTEGQRIILGSFQKVHIRLSSNETTPTVFIQSTTTTTSLENNATEGDEGDPDPTAAMESPHRIVGGRVVSITEVPWQVAVIQDRSFACGGSVISTIWVLTAAHCIYGFGSSNFFVRAGSPTFRSGGQLRRVDLKAVHGQYVPNQTVNDIAMLRLTRRFVFGSTVRPIPLAKVITRVPNVLFVSGWGSTNATTSTLSRLLRGVNVNFINRDVCSRLYAGSGVAIDLSTSICAGNVQGGGGRDSCDGDSGGPLVSRGILFGIVSSGAGCGDANFPGIYTDVGALNGWILNVARSLSTRSITHEKGPRDHEFNVIVLNNEGAN